MIFLALRALKIRVVSLPRDTLYEVQGAANVHPRLGYIAYTLTMQVLYRTAFLRGYIFAVLILDKTKPTLSNPYTAARYPLTRNEDV